MESQLFLGVIIALHVSCLLVNCGYGTFLESAIDIEVIGNNIVRSGVRKYTLFGDSAQLEFVNCKVKNDTGKLKNVTIVKDGERVNYDYVNGSVSYKLSDDFTIKNDSVIYTCRAMFEVKNQSFSVQYYLEKDTEVIANVETFIIASDVGSRVYTGEQVSVSCDGHYNEWEEEMQYTESINSGIYIGSLPFKSDCTLSLIGNPFSTIAIPTVGPVNVTCDLRKFGRDTNVIPPAQSPCSKEIYLELDVASELNVSLSPLRFDRLSKTLAFTCTSDPPRLMYWTVLTVDNTNIMDMQNSPALSANVTINITQKPGNTSIIIQVVREDDKSDKGIQTVICSTKAQVFKTAQRRATDDHSSTSAAAAMKEVNTLSITLVTILLVVVVVLVLVIIFLFMKMRQNKVLVSQSPDDFPNGDDGVNEDNDTVPAETVLHDNPMYLSYEERDETQQNDVPFLPPSEDCNYKDDEGNDEAPNETDLQDNPTYQPYTGTDELL